VKSECARDLGAAHRDKNSKCPGQPPPSMPANAIHVFCIALAPLKKSNRTFGTRGCTKPRTAVALCATATRSAQCGAAASQRGLRSMSRRRRSRPALAAASIDGVMRPADVAIPPAITSRTPPAAECDPRDQAFRPRTLYETQPPDAVSSICSGFRRSRLLSGSTTAACRLRCRSWSVRGWTASSCYLPPPYRRAATGMIAFPMR